MILLLIIIALVGGLAGGFGLGCVYTEWRALHPATLDDEDV